MNQKRTLSATFSLFLQKPFRNGWFQPLEIASRETITSLLLFWLTVLTSGVAKATPPEGLDNFGIIGRGKGSSSLSTRIDYKSVKWGSDHISLQIIGSVPTFIANQLTIGGKATVANTLGDRSAYFLRYDWRFGKMSSLGFKWIHEDLKFINSSKDSIAIDYNSFFDWGPKLGFYISLGGYYRWLKQSWNEPWWAPLNLNTRDQQGLIQSCVGWQKGFGTDNFLTFDFNIRDNFDYHNIDTIAADLTLNFSDGPGFYWTTIVGVRNSAVLVGTLYPAEIYFGFGFNVY